MEYSEFARIFVKLQYYFGSELDDSIVNIYWESLKTLKTEQLLAASQRAIAECQWMPKIAELRKLAGISTERDAAAAWTTLLTAMRRVGSYDSPEFDDPVIPIVAKELGGWVMLCRTPLEDLLYRVKPQFLRAYSALKIDGTPDGYRAQLRGRFDGDPVRIPGLASAGQEAVRILGQVGGGPARLTDGQASTEGAPESTRPTEAGS